MKKEKKKIIKICSVSLFLFFAIFFVAGEVFAETYYIDFESGDDTASGTSIETAWKTLPGTRTLDGSDWLRTEWGNGTFLNNNKVPPGTTFKLRPGTTYDSSVAGYIWINRDFYEDANENNPIKIERDITWGSGSVIFDGNNIYTPIALILIQANGVIIDGKSDEGIVIKNAEESGIQVKEKPGTGDPVYDNQFHYLKFFNNGKIYTELNEGYIGQLQIRHAINLTISDCIFDGNSNHCMGIILGETHKYVKNGNITNCTVYNHEGKDPPNDSGIGIKAFNSQVLFNNCTVYNNLKGFALGEQNGDDEDMTYKIINSVIYNNEYGINLNSSAEMDYAGESNFYLINNVIRNNRTKGSNIYSGSFNLYMVHNTYAYNGKVDDKARANLSIGASSHHDETEINAYLYNNIFYKPITKPSGMNFMVGYLGDGTSGYDTVNNFYFDYNSWVQNENEYFAQVAYYGGSHRAQDITYAFSYGSNGPGNINGLWYTEEGDPGNGIGHLQSDANSKGTESSDPTLPSFEDIGNNDYSLTSSYQGLDLTSKSWYIAEMGTDINNVQRSSWDIGAYEFNKDALVDNENPTTPTSLIATAISTSQINLSWTASTDNTAVTGYRIYKDNVEITTTNQTSYQNTGLSSNTEYSYQITAYDQAENESSRTTEVTATTEEVAETTPPTGSININNNEEYTNTANISLNLSATDESGVSLMKLSDQSDNFDSLGEIVYTTTYNWVISGIDGIKTVYVWFADTLGNWMTSPTSDTIILDTISPSKITNLSANSITETSANLAWIASGDDGNEGVAVSYDVRYSTISITDSNNVSEKENWWDNTIQFTGEPTPSVQGTEEYVSVGLSAGTTYYLAIRVSDEADNISDISNILTITTEEESSNDNGGENNGGSGGGGGSTQDNTPPNETQNAKAIGADKQTILVWTNPTDNDFIRVKILRKENAYPLDHNDTGAIVVYEGNQEQFTDTELTNNKTYYYSIFTYDKKPNYSAGINILATTVAGKETITEIIKNEETEDQSKETAQEILDKDRKSLFGLKSAEVERISLSESRRIHSHNQYVSFTKLVLEVYEKLVAKLENLTEKLKYSMALFIGEGTPTTIILGSGERAGVINSFNSAFEKNPESEQDWQDIIKIANGRWPTQRTTTKEENAKKIFKVVYLRDPNMSQPNDNAAVTVITYGLRPTNRNLNSERVAIKTYRYIYKKDPLSAQEWDIVRAIAYSGAIR